MRTHPEVVRGLRRLVSGLRDGAAVGITVGDVVGAGGLVPAGPARSAVTR